MSDTSQDAHPEAGNAQGEEQSDASGQTVDDAVESAYDTWDEGQHGIAEGDRVPMGQWLQRHARDAGTTVKGGLESLVATTAVLRGGDQEQKRQMIGHLVDQYGIRERPGAENPAPAIDEFGDPAAQYPQESVTPYAASVGEIVGADPAAVGQFLAANPIARDPQIQVAMVEVAQEMLRQGLQPDGQTMLSVAIDQVGPREPQQAQDARHVAQARAASGQVSGSGNSAANQASDDLDAVLNELTPQW